MSAFSKLGVAGLALLLTALTTYAEASYARDIPSGEAAAAVALNPQPLPPRAPPPPREDDDYDFG